MKTINLPHVYHTARSMSYDQFEQTIKSDLTGKPITEVIECTPVVVAEQPAVSEGEINDIFNGVATHTTEEGILLMSEQEFKWAIESLNVQGEAQQRYEKAKKLTLECTGNKILSEFEEDILSIAAGLPPQEKGGEG